MSSGKASTTARTWRYAERRLVLPADEEADYSCLLAYNVLEHIDDDAGAVRSMARLVRPDGYLVLVCPAFGFAMSPVDVATGQTLKSLVQNTGKLKANGGTVALTAVASRRAGWSLWIRLRNWSETLA